MTPHLQAPNWRRRLCGRSAIDTHPPLHPDANRAVGLALVGLIGLFTGGVALLMSPVALAMARRILREIDADGAQWSGRRHALSAQHAAILGIVSLPFWLAAAAWLLVVGPH